MKSEPMEAPHAISPTGWWIAGLLERHQKPEGIIYWNNLRLIRAEHWREAFQKATALGHMRIEVGNRAFSHIQEFVGVTNLVPIYDPFEDGAEMLWEEYDSQEDNAKEAPLDIYFRG
jgi:hypothetical protein